MRGAGRILITEIKLSPAPAESHIHVQRSPWHSPLPYFFGGLAAILGLIAFALLMLACSYFRNSGEGDVEAASGEKTGDAGKKSCLVFEEKILVIMAGNVNPTFLATRASSCGGSLGGDSQGKGKRCEGENEKFEGGEKMKEDDVISMDDRIQIVLSSEDQNQS